MYIDLKENLHLFNEFVNIYEDSFEPNEQESKESILNRVKSGFYKLIALKKDGQIVGFYILDLVKPFVVVMYIAVEKNQRGKGLGSEMIEQIKEYFSSLDGYFWLLIEAKHKQSLLYERFGFKKLDFFYAIPSFDKSDDIVKMNLLLMQKEKNITQEKLRFIIHQIFTQGYRLQENDERLIYQLNQIPQHIKFTKVEP